MSNVYNLFITNLTIIRPDVANSILNSLDNDQSKLPLANKFKYHSINNEFESFSNYTSNGAALHYYHNVKNIDINGIIYMHTQALNNTNGIEGNLKVKDVLIKQFKNICNTLNDNDIYPLDHIISDTPNHLELLSISTKLVEKILDIQDKEKKDVHIYVDSNGGFRDAMLIIVALLNTFKQFKKEKIVVKSIIGINFSDNKGFILEKIKAFSIYDLSSGIDEFVKYGNASMIKMFFQNTLEDDTYKLTTNMKNVLNSIDKISDAFSLCNPKCIIDGLYSLNNNIDKYINEVLIDEKDYLDDMFIFLCKRIKEGFYDIFEAMKTIQNGDFRSNYKVIKQVLLYCLDHRLIQQAFTIYSELLPDCLYNNKVIHVSDKYELKEHFERKYESSKTNFSKGYVYIQQYMLITKEGLIDKYKRDKNIRRYYDRYEYLKLMLKQGYVKTKFKPTDDNVKIIVDVIKDYRDIKDKRNDSNHAADVNERDILTEISLIKDSIKKLDILFR